MWLRLCFGGTGCPPAWCAVGKMIVDLANDLLQNQAFLPNQSTSRYLDMITPPKPYIGDHQLGVAKPIMVEPPTRQYGYFDMFVDNIIGLVVEGEGQVDRLSQALVLSMDATFRPPVPNETLPRNDCLHLGKTFIEGAPSETITILGWDVDLRSLIISLPQDKLIAWRTDIKDIIKANKLTKKELETLIGRLSHSSMGIPMTRYYLGRLYYNIGLYHNDFEERKLHKPDVKLLKLWISFLEKSAAGISINLLTFRQPTAMCISDACPEGMGGYSVRTGRAWRFKLAHGMKDKNNIIE